MTTILDVARVANVSTATVSRVINHPETVKDSTKERVFRAMEICDYSYNALARSFATKRSHTIGLIVPTITNPIFADSTRGVQDIAEANGYRVVLANTDYDRDKEADSLRVFREFQVDGIIATASNPKSRDLAKLVRDNFPIVLLHSTLRSGQLSCVGVDNYLGGFMATEHLIKHGHTRIAMLAVSFSASDKSFHRWHGYKRCLAEHGLPYNPEMLIQADYSLESGKNGMKKLLALKTPPTAVFCSNDFLAVGAMEGAREKCLSLPTDLSIVGFDDMLMSTCLSPGLDTIRQPAYEMGQRGAKVLLDKIVNPETKPVHEMMEIELIQRQSVCSL